MAPVEQTSNVDITMPERATLLGMFVLFTEMAEVEKKWQKLSRAFPHTSTLHQVL